MTILPLIERELRVRARSRMVYWTRFAVALAGILICLPALTASAGPWSATQARMGQSAFQGLVDAAFVLCCGVGFLAVEGISRERREGTLGLLFLTRVKAFDVLLGSFGAVGITCVCALIAFLPMLILPVLAGGVTGGEAARTMLVLLDTLFLSLGVGLWAAARGRGWFESARTALLLLLSLVLAPVLFIQALHAIYDAQQSHGLLMEFLSGWVRSANAGGLGLVSPFYTLHRAADVSYRVTPAGYWISLAGVFGIAWLLLVSAGIRLRRTMREVEVTANATPVRQNPHGQNWMPKSFVLWRWEIWRARPAQGEPMEDGMDPIVWLLRKRRGVKAAIWAAVVVGTVHYYGIVIYYRFHGPTSDFAGIGLAVSVIQGVLFAWAASRFFVEARRTGELELLLTTPFGAGRIVSSQWLWLKRLLTWPLVFLVAPNLVDNALFVWQNFFFEGLGDLIYIFVSDGLYVVNTIFSLVALFWAGLWFGLHSRSQAVAILRAILLAKGVPYLRFGVLLIVPIVNFFVAQNAFSYLRLSANLGPSILNLCYYLWLWRWARRRLQTELAHEGTGGVKLGEFVGGIFSAKSLYK